MEEAELEKFIEELHSTHIEVTQLKNEMKQLPLVQNMAKVT